jgi:two-component system, NtrC family, sensor kinase
MLRGDDPISIIVWHSDVGPSRKRTSRLPKTFADQAVIAIENVWLFTELQEKNGALTEALEQQTATPDLS